MASLVQLLNEWEIQMLVLLSFMLQAFLFFGGGLRRRTRNGFLRLLLWIAYLGADWVAAYALGLISRQEDATAGRDAYASMGTHQLVFLWASFLLIHLGGQDTITAFALEDNNLWLRHLLNLSVQVSLALYIFWKSANGLNMQLLVQSILPFVSGTIKYGERTWALRSGVLKTLAESPLPHYAGQLQKTLGESPCLGRDEVNRFLEQIHSDRGDRGDSSSENSVLSIALCSMESVLSFLWHNGSYHAVLSVWKERRLLPKVLDILEIELGLVYDYIYTKAMVLQTRGGIVLRCISQACFLASFVLFLVSNKKRYNSIDTAITYALFAGGFSLEVCAAFTTLMSPWTWAWLEARHCSSLASIIIWWKRKGVVLWSNSMGQYNLYNYLGKYDQQQSSSACKRGVMAGIRKVADKTCGEKQKFWISKQLDIKFVEVDKEIMSCIFQKVVEYAGSVQYRDHHTPGLPQRWPNLGVLLKKVLPSSDGTLDGRTIAALHAYTEAQLKVYSPANPSDDADGESTAVLVRKLSNYMVYLLATQPGMLPLSENAESRFRKLAMAAAKTGNNDELLSRLGVQIPGSCTKEQLLETKEAWIRLLVYIAGRSRPEIHAAQLARGGELLTFVWLFMAFRGLGDSVLSRIETIDEHVPTAGVVLFRFPRLQPEQTDSNSIPDLQLKVHR